MNCKIAVCDDEPVICKTIYTMITALSDKTGIRFEIDCFTSGEELCREMEGTAYDLIFLDIEFPEMNGVEVGKHIRDVLNNESVQIVYISSKQQYAMALFDIRPMNFLIKPITQDKLREIMDKFVKLNAMDAGLFRFRMGKEHLKLPVSEIIYFSSSGRTVTLYTTAKKYTFYGSLDQIDNELKNGQFLYIHKSFLVNYQYIRHYEYEQVTLLDGTVLPVSQPRRKQIRRRILEMEE